MLETSTVEPEKKEVEQTEEEHAGLSHLSDKDRAEILKLREESAARRVKAKEIQAELDRLKDEQEKEKMRKLEEDGKLKEVITAKEEEIEKLKSLKEENEKNTAFFTEQLESVLGKLSPTQRELIENSAMIPAEKLKYANKLAAEGLELKDGPDSVRPGGSPNTEDINIQEYMGKDNRGKLLALREVNPKLYQKILELKNTN